MMGKYSGVYHLVSRLTDDPTLRTFFIVYLMAESEQRRRRLAQQFWQDAKTLKEADYRELKAAYNHSFKQLLPLANELYNKVLSAQAESTISV